MRQDALEPGNDITICPLRLLLAHATRHMNVDGTTIEEVLDWAANSQGEKTIWKNGDLPVFYQT